jgi:ABC-type sugar transport system substrate-binding protein
MDLDLFRPAGDRPEELTGEIVDAVDDVVRGRISRSDFIRRGAALGLSATAVSGVLAATASAGGRRVARPTRVDANVARIQRIVYPTGLAAEKRFPGPFGRSTAAVLPADYHGPKNARGVWNWGYDNFKADRDYRVAFAHFSAKWDLSVELVARAKAVGEQIGVTVDGFDNNFDADTAIKNAQLIAQQGYDFAVFAQIFPDASKTIFRTLQSANINSGYLAVEATGEPKAIFADMGNNRMCFALGRWLGLYAKRNWGGKVDMVVLGAQPRAGKYVAQREVGYRAGIRSVLGNVPNSVFKTIDTQGLLPNAQQKTADLLTSNPRARYIIGCGTNDDTGVGITRALEAAGRDKQAVVAGQAGQQSAVDELTKGTSAFKVSGFVDVATWTWLIPVGVLAKMGGQVATNHLVPYYLTTSRNVRQFPKQVGAYNR